MAVRVLLLEELVPCPVVPERCVRCIVVQVELDLGGIVEVLAGGEIDAERVGFVSGVTDIFITLVIDQGRVLGVDLEVHSGIAVPSVPVVLASLDLPPGPYYAEVPAVVGRVYCPQVVSVHVIYQQLVVAVRYDEHVVEIEHAKCVRKTFGGIDDPNFRSCVLVQFQYGTVIEEAVHVIVIACDTAGLASVIVVPGPFLVPVPVELVEGPAVIPDIEASIGIGAESDGMADSVSVADIGARIIVTGNCAARPGLLDPVLVVVPVVDRAVLGIAADGPGSQVVEIIGSPLLLLEGFHGCVFRNFRTGVFVPIQDRFGNEIEIRYDDQGNDQSYTCGLHQFQFFHSLIVIGIPEMKSKT